MASKTAAAANAKVMAATSRVNQLVSEAEELQAELKKVRRGSAGDECGKALSYLLYGKSLWTLLFC